MTALDFVVIILSVLYFSVLLAKDSLYGPFSILHKIRELVGVEWENGWPRTEPGSLADLIMCPYCNSVWVGIVIVALYASAQAIGLPARWLFSPAAAAGVVVIVQEVKPGS